MSRLAESLRDPHGTVRIIRSTDHAMGVFKKVADLFAYRELLGNLVRKELKVRYRNSVLGFVWSMLNPAMYLVIFYAVFTVFLRSGIPYFPIFLLSGLLGWNLLSSSLGGAAGSIVGNASLVTKVYFPREILPLASIGASVVHFSLQFLVLIAGVMAFTYPVDPGGLILIPAALLTELLFLAGLTLIISSANVYFRDVQHFLDLLLLAWFWMTPIVYPVRLVSEHAGDLLWKIYSLNPMMWIALGFQRGVYGKVEAAGADGKMQPILLDMPVSGYLTRLGVIALVGIVLIYLGLKLFGRLESRLAEEL